MCSAAVYCYQKDPWRCATTFIGPMGMGASFNKTSWYLKGGVIGTEMRAFNNLGWCVELHASACAPLHASAAAHVLSLIRMKQFFRFLASGRHNDPNDKIGLTGFGPNINIARVRAGGTLESVLHAP